MCAIIEEFIKPNKEFIVSLSAVVDIYLFFPFNSNTLKYLVFKV